ncbi:MAG: hypothetical protein J5667_04170 [Bacteroidales bacterium]|nr:hypothetical protein [Bacteroidales bacterium]
MKKYIFITIAAISILAVGCKKEVAPIDEPTPIENNVIEEQPIAGEDMVTYSFTIDNKDLKSTLDNEGHFAWVTGDHIAIYNETSTSYVDFEVKSVDGSGNATIEASASPGAVWTNAIYPAARATGSGNAVDYTVTTVSGPILVSKVDGQNLNFKYLGAVANIRVDGVPGTPTTLTFTANSNVFGSRTFSWSGDSPVLGGSGSQASITVPFTNATIISVPIPQVSYTGGFTIAVKNAGGRILYKKTTTNTFDMSSKKLLPMPTLTYEAPTKYYVKTVSASGYWDRGCVRMIQTGDNTYNVQMNCDGGTDVYIFDNYNIGNETTGYLNKGHVDGGNFYEISWNTSTSSGGPNYISGTRDYPFFHDAYPVGEHEMSLSGSFNSWSHDANPFTYNLNMSWSLEGLTIASAGTYTFKIRKNNSDWSYAAGGNSGLGSSLYGSLKGDNGDASINLAAGTYNVYLNATSDWYYNIMFEKQ